MFLRKTKTRRKTRRAGGRTKTLRSRSRLSAGLVLPVVTCARVAIAECERHGAKARRRLLWEGAGVGLGFDCEWISGITNLCYHSSEIFCYGIYYMMMMDLVEDIT